MMELSSHAYLPLVADREEPPLIWHHGIPSMDHPNNAFAMEMPGHTNVQSRGREVAALDDSYANECGDITYGWANALSLPGNGIVPPIVVAEQSRGYQLDSKGMVHAAVTPLGFGDGTIQDIVGDQMLVRDGNGGFGTVDVMDDFEALAAEFAQNNHSWEQQKAYLNLNSHSVVHATTAKADAALVAFAPAVGIANIELEYPLAPQPLANGLGVSQVKFPEDNTYYQRGQDDETSQIGYISIAHQPNTNNFVSNPAIEQWIDPYVVARNVSSLPNTMIGDGPLLDSVDGLFTAAELGLSGDLRPPSSYGLPFPMDEGQLALSSREPSISGAWGSPGSQFGWDPSSISPSPNPHAFSMPDGPMDEVFQNALSTGLMNEFAHSQSIMLVQPSQPTLKDMMGQIEVSKQNSKRKRQAYTTEGKKKVNLVRENGACVSCHARKIPCATGGVCEGCLKTTGDPVLAKEICLRTKLKDIYKSVKDIHDTLDDRQRRLIPLLESLTGEPKSVDLTVANARLGYKFQLRLQVKKCTSSPSCRWKRLTKVNGIYITRDVIQDQRYVIVPTSLPSIDDYDNFGRQILATSNGSHSGSLTQHLDEFLIGFCKNSQPSRLRQFANSTLRVASLSRLVAYGFLNLYDGSYDLLDRTTGIPINENALTRRYVSETVHDQLRILAAEGLVPVEEVVFKEIDNLNKNFGKVRNGKIVAGICVLRLMLLYRDRVIRDSIRLNLPRGGERHKKRLGKAAFMYKRLTIAYGTLCRESTPLIMTWQQENERDPTVEDLVMTNLFSLLHPAFEEFCNEKLNPEYDDLLKGLIIEASRIERRPSKKRKAEQVKECDGAC